MKWESWKNHADVSRNEKSLCKQRFLPPSPSGHLNIPNDLERVRRSECAAEGVFPLFLRPASWRVKWVCLSWVDYFVVVWSSTATLSHVLIYFLNKCSSHTYTHTGLVTPTTYIKSWRSTTRVEMELWTLSWRESMIGLQNRSCKNVLMFMVWEHAQTFKCQWEKLVAEIMYTNWNRLVWFINLCWQVIFSIMSPK